MFGPSEWHVELILNSNEKTYEFKDLLQVPSIGKRTKDNKCQEKTSNRIRDEITWLLELQRFVIGTRALTASRH